MHATTSHTEQSSHPEISVANLRSSLGDTINRATYAGDRVIITRRGKPSAAIISSDDLAYFEALEDAADSEALAAARRADDGYRVGIDAIATKYGL